MCEPYHQIPLGALSNISEKKHIGIDTNSYDVGSIIHYKGKCFDLCNFYAKIDKMTKTSIDITVLELEYANDTIKFYETDSKQKGLTRRPFYLINK